MNVLLSGQKAFGAAVLELLLARGHGVAAVSCPPETNDGRPDRLWTLAARLGLPLIRAGTLSAATMPGGVDLILCAHSHDFIGAATRGKTRLGAMGYHPSLLPLHRGRDAVYWTLRMGDKVAGGSVYWLTDVVDGGPIAAQGWCFTRPGDTPSGLWQRELFPLGLRLIAKALDDLDAGLIVSVPQDQALATWEPSVGRPPVYRPDLIPIGPAPEGFRVVRRRENAASDFAGESSRTHA
jgi:methionyl-tRNA formyltransferase